MKWLITVIIIVLLIAGGVYLARNSGVSAPAAGEIVRGWTLESHNGKSVSGNISFQADGKFSAQICNNYGGSYVYDSGEVGFSQVAGTLMLCADETLNKAEAAFTRITQTGAKATVKDGKLQLQSGGDKLIFY